MTRGARPDYEDVLEAIGKAQGAAGARLHARILGKSTEGREIPCLLYTDPAVPDQDKQRVYVVAGQSGAKESGRAVALALMEFLGSDDAEARQILASQVVAIVPCANPDGAQRDTSANAKGEPVASSYRIDQPSAAPEGWMLERFGLAFAPEAFVDLQGRAGGGMKEYCWVSPALPFSSDRYFATIMSTEMARAAEEAGFPQHEVFPPREIGGGEGLNTRHGQSEKYLGVKLAAEVKSLSFGLESIEQYYREPQWRASGLVRLRRLLRFGMEDFFGLGTPGYPCMLISGSRIYGLIAHGTTAAARRQNRVEVSNFLRHNFCYADRGEDGLDRCATMVISSRTCEGINPERFSMLLRIKKPCRVQAVEWKGQALGCGEESGYQTWENANSVLVKTNVLEPLGGPSRYLTVRYESPLLEK